MLGAEGYGSWYKRYRLAMKLAIDGAYSAQFVVSELVCASPEVFRDPNHVTCRQCDLLADIEVEALDLS